MAADQIVHFDFNDINHSSFYLSGIRANQSDYGFRFSMKGGLPEQLRTHRFGEQEKKNLPHINLFEAQVEGQTFLFCIDTHDSCERSTGYNELLLKAVKYYFKVNYNEAEIAQDPELRAQARKIVPAPTFFPVKTTHSAAFLPRSLPNDRTNWTAGRSWSRIKRIRQIPALHDLKQLRTEPKEIDVFFVVTYYTKDHHSHIADTRLQLVESLVDHPDIHAVAGLLSNKPMPPHLERLRVERMDRKRYLNNLARARLAIYVRGPHDCLSFKLGELLAMGKPIVGQKLLNNAAAYYKYPYFTEQFNYESSEEIVERIGTLLQDEVQLADIARSNAAVFDSHLTPRAAAGSVLDYVYGRKRWMYPNTKTQKDQPT